MGISNRQGGWRTMICCHISSLNGAPEIVNGDKCRHLQLCAIHKWKITRPQSKNDGSTREFNAPRFESLVFV